MLIKQVFYPRLGNCDSKQLFENISFTTETKKNDYMKIAANSKQYDNYLSFGYSRTFSRIYLNYISDLLEQEIKTIPLDCVVNEKYQISNIFYIILASKLRLSRVYRFCFKA